MPSQDGRAARNRHADAKHADAKQTDAKQTDAKRAEPAPAAGMRGSAAGRATQGRSTQGGESTGTVLVSGDPGWGSAQRSAGGRNDSDRTTTELAARAARVAAVRGDEFCATLGAEERDEHAHGPKGLPRPAERGADDSARVDVERAATLESESSGAAAWRPWLAGGSSREVLARIVNEDPLGVRDHVAHALRTGHFLLDGDRVLLRCFALVARHAVRYRGRPQLAEWLECLAREAIASILREDGEAERRPFVPGHEPGRAHGAAFAALAKPLGLDSEALGRACLAFNRLAQADRAAFFALVIAGRSLDELARASGESGTEIARRARRALDTLLTSAATSPAQKSEAARDRGATPERGKGAKASAARASSHADRSGPGKQVTT